ncbi:MAG: type II secretion system protein GspK [Bdellovibrionales bacterium]
MKIQWGYSCGHFLKRLRQPVNNKKGVALIMTLAALNVILPLALDLSEVTTLEYNVSSQSINRIRAYYAARAGTEVGLLRVLLYQKAKAQVGEQLGEQAEILDLIYQFPFEWPPNIPEGLNAVETSQIKKNTAESFMESKFFLTIEDEGQKIDINALASESERLRNSTRAQIQQIFLNKMSNDEAFEETHRGTNFDELLDNLVDWVDADEDRQSGGAESSIYPIVEDAGKIPPNGPFRTIDEIKLVAGMNEDVYRLLKDRVTIYGVQGININSAPAEVLMTLDPQMDEDTVQLIIDRRSDEDKGGPFSDEEDFLNFLDQESSINVTDFNQSKTPLFFGEKFNFRITSVGQHNNILREIQVITYDFDSLKNNLVKYLDDESDKETDPQGAGEQTSPPESETTGESGEQGQETTPGGPPKTEKATIPTGRPRIVFWGES